MTILIYDRVRLAQVHTTPEETNRYAEFGIRDVSVRTEADRLTTYLVALASDLEMTKPSFRVRSSYYALRCSKQQEFEKHPWTSRLSIAKKI
ncbi:unnamed protein product [Somion occarium]|uniref:Uncharacterized protein n=1 Tax=Somion occarium TaxID=3059160 RepID=A0ABP1CXJ3_9APHY